MISFYTPIPSTLPELSAPTSNIPVTYLNSLIYASNDAHAAVRHSTRGHFYIIIPSVHTYHWEFLEVCSDYSCITLQVPKNCLLLAGPCLHLGEEEGRCRNYYLLCSRLYKYGTSLHFCRNTNKSVTVGLSNITWILPTYILQYVHSIFGNLYGIIAKVLNCGIKISTFKFQSCYYIHFQTNTLWNGILEVMG